MRWRRVIVPLGLVGTVAILAGCRTVEYYGQAVAGQWSIMSKRRPIDRLVADPSTPADLKRKLRVVEEIREFAARELHLPVDGQYRKYTDLGRRYVVWNVHAAPEFSLEPKSWWYPVVGSLTYRGYFSEAAAEAYAAQLHRRGFEVHVEGVTAYSTLGWFRDPVLNTFLFDEDADLAETLFHELAHQRVFVSGDTDFSEAFATTVGQEGARRWLKSKGDPRALVGYEAEIRRNEQFVELVMGARERLAVLYEDNRTLVSSPGTRPAAPDKGAVELAHGRRNPDRAPDPATLQVLRWARAGIVRQLREDYARLKTEWGGQGGYDAWFARSLNNAQLNTVDTYYRLVPTFRNLLAACRGDMERFFGEMEALARLPADARVRGLEAAVVKNGSRAGRPRRGADF